MNIYYVVLLTLVTQHKIFTVIIFFGRLKPSLIQFSRYSYNHVMLMIWIAQGRRILLLFALSYL